MNIDYFIDKFEAIPENQWCIMDQINDSGQRCALGHCMPKVVHSNYSCYGHATEEGIALTRIFKDTDTVVGINNGYHQSYQQPTPKQRMLAALRDLKPELKPFSQPKNIVHEQLDSILH